MCQALFLALDIVFVLFCFIFLFFTTAPQVWPHHRFTDEKSEAWSSSASCPNTATQLVGPVRDFCSDVSGSRAHTVFYAAYAFGFLFSCELSTFMSLTWSFE